MATVLSDRLARGAVSPHEADRRPGRWYHLTEEIEGMRNRIRYPVVAVCCVLVGVATFIVRRPAASPPPLSEEAAGGVARTRLTQAGRGIAYVLPPANFRALRGHGRLDALPKLSAKPREGSSMDLRSTDLRALDLSGKRAELERADFDSQTQWPAAMPKDFDPGAIMELARNPGLGVRALQAKGLTGRGVSLGIIDTGLLVNHQEYRDRLKLYEEIHCWDGAADMHGAAVASIAVGKTVGVAPGADLYYIAETHVRDDIPRQGNVNLWDYVDFSVTAKSIRRLLEINRTLPPEKRIRAIAIMVGWEPTQTGYKEVTAAVKEAKAEGVFVISSALSRTHGLNFHGLGREPRNDPEDPSSYYLITAWGPGLAEPTLVIPMDSRTTASPTGASDYVFYRQGGWSWVAPYLAGLYALACQVRPDVTPELFWEKALETGATLDLSKAPPIPQAPRPARPTAPTTRPEARARMANRFDAIIGELRKSESAEEVRQKLLAKHQEVTGKPAPEVNDAKLRDLMIELMTDEEMQRSASPAPPAPTEPKMAKIVNPRRLMEALRK